MADIQSTSKRNIDIAVKEGEDLESPVKKQCLDPKVKGLNLDTSETFKASLREYDVGIVEYIGQGEGFFGILKQRHSDFLVNEVDERGDTVILTEIEHFKEKTAENVLDLNTSNSIDSILEGTLTEFKIEVTNRSKEERMKIHKSIKAKSTKLETETKEIDGLKCIVVKKKSDKKSNRKVSHDVNVPFIHFTLYKENMDTMEAILKLSQALCKKPQCFTYAGVKDKRAKTTQKVCVKKCGMNDLALIGKRWSNLYVGNFEKKQTALRLGQLTGNRFSIVLREVNGKIEKIDQALSSLSALGFINYFGMQRFGTTTIPTHRIGQAIVSKNFKEAVELILKPRVGDKEQMKAAREIWWSTRDHLKAYNALKFPNCLEGRLLKGLLAMKEDNYLSALEYIPRNTLMMYIHSYQSYIWNMMVTKRIQLFGLHVQPGDLVLKHSGKEIKCEDNSNVIVLNDINLSEYSINDVVLPLPGYSVVIPENMAVYYKDLLERDGLTMQSFKKKNESKWMALYGTYRPLVVVPKKTTWRFVQYNDPLEPLLLSDVDKLEGKTITYLDKGQYKAVIVEFTLPSSVYASMAIRELTHLDTSSANQRTLNNKSNFSMTK